MQEIWFIYLLNSGGPPELIDSSDTEDGAKYIMEEWDKDPKNIRGYLFCVRTVGFTS